MGHTQGLRLCRPAGSAVAPISQIGCGAGLQTRAGLRAKLTKERSKRSGDLEIPATAGLETGATKCYAVAAASGALSSLNLTDTSFETPGSCMVTP